MKFNLQILAAAAAVLVAGPATAALTLGSVAGGSSLVLSVWDNVANVSYTRNLGPNLNSFLPSGFTTLPNDGTVTGTPNVGDKTPDGGLNLSFAGDALFATTFGASQTANIEWNIVAIDQLVSNTLGLSRVITTAAAKPSTTNGGVGNIAAGGNNYFNALLANTTIGNAGVNSVSTTESSLQSFAGNPNWGFGLNGGLNGVSSGGIGQSLGFFYLARTQIPTGATATLATNLQFANAAGAATWTLGGDGTAIYNVSAVPLPPALWLMGSGLLAVAGAVRRRKAKASAKA